MLYREINKLCGQNVEFVNVKPGDKYSNHWAFQRQYRFGWWSAVIGWGMDMSELPGEMRKTKVKILVWSSKNMQWP